MLLGKYWAPLGEYWALLGEGFRVLGLGFNSAFYSVPAVIVVDFYM